MQGYKFRQVPIGHYIADFACHEARLIVEIEGGQHDRSSPPEAERSGFLQNEGYRILRFWNNDILANLDGVFETIAEELSRITPAQTLPHQGGGLLSSVGRAASRSGWQSCVLPQRGRRVSHRPGDDSMPATH
jgi:Protein of unknown function (DUF559)